MPGTTLNFSRSIQKSELRPEPSGAHIDFNLVGTNPYERKYHHSSHFDALRADVIIAQFTSLSPKGFRVQACFRAQLSAPKYQRKTAREDN